MLSIVQLVALLDSVAAGVASFVASVGSGVESGTVSKAASDDLDVLAAINDPDVQAQITPTFARRASLVTADALRAGLQGPMLQRALDTHYGKANAGNVNVFLRQNGEQVHPYLRLIGFQIDADNAFMPTVLDPVASYAGTGAGTGTYAAGSDVDVTQYGPAKLEIVVNTMGASARTLHVTGKNFDGTTAVVDVTVPGNAAPGSVYPIGTGRFVGVANITSANGTGTSADGLHVRSIVERSIAI